MSYNGPRIEGEGNITRELETRVTNSGTVMVTTGVAITKRAARESGREDDTSFFDVVIFGSQGENAAKSLRKGDRVYISGTFSSREYTDRDGATRRSNGITVDVIAPSMRWAETAITRNPKQGSGGAAAATAAADPFAPVVNADDDEPF